MALTKEIWEEFLRILNEDSPRGELLRSMHKRFVEDIDKQILDGFGPDKTAKVSDKTKP